MKVYVLQGCPKYQEPVLVSIHKTKESAEAAKEEAEESIYDLHLRPYAVSEYTVKE